MTNRNRPSGPAPETDVRLLDLLQRSGAAISSKLDLQSAAQTVIDQAAAQSGASAGTVFYAQDGRDRGVLSRREPRWDAFAHVGDPRGAPLPASVMSGGEILFSGNLAADPARTPVTPLEGLPPDSAADVRSYLAVPVVLRSGAVIGGLALGHRERDVFTEWTKRLVTGIAAQAAIAFDNALLYEATRRTAEERARLLDTERAARSQLEQASAKKDEALAILSHDLRSPLNSILGWSEVLLARVGADSEHRHGLEAIARNARVQARMIAELIDHNRTVATQGKSGAAVAELAAVLPWTRPRPSGQLQVSLDGVTVLVIDDDDDARDLVKTILVDAKADAVTAASADEGVALLRRVHPDVIVSDIGMSVRDGYQFIRLVRMLAPPDGGKTPAVALTAFVQPEDRARALLAGYQEHLSKPVEADVLVAAVRRLAARGHDVR